MAADKPQQDAILAAIEAKISAWTAVADSYRAAVALDGSLGDVTVGLTGVTPPASVGRMQASIDLPVGVFRDKSLKEAIPIYLGAGRRKQTNKEIATGLQTGGFPTTAENFEATIATALYRLKNEGVVLRFPDGWDLASSYPDSLRNRLEKDPKPRRISGAKPKTAAKRRQPSAKAEESATAKPRRRRTAADGPSINQRILKILTVEGPNLPAAFVARLGKPSNVVGLALGRLTKLGKAEKLASGHYAVFTQEAVLRAV